MSKNNVETYINKFVFESQANCRDVEAESVLF